MDERAGARRGTYYKIKHSEKALNVNDKNVLKCEGIKKNELHFEGKETIFIHR